MPWRAPGARGSCTQPSQAPSAPLVSSESRTPAEVHTTCQHLATGCTYGKRLGPLSARGGGVKFDSDWQREVAGAPSLVPGAYPAAGTRRQQPGWCQCGSACARRGSPAAGATVSACPAACVPHCRPHWADPGQGGDSSPGTAGLAITCGLADLSLPVFQVGRVAIVTVTVVCQPVLLA